ncbi:MAG: response regulator [Sandaracinaceae bacterium]|nr:response regulator [Sandaracinaceae bacterium]
MDRSAMSADVVVVDDDPRVRKVLGYLLEREGLAVRSYGSPHAALDFVLAHPPPVLVTDLQMPGLDGAGLAAAVRGGLGERSPRILLLTGNPRALRPRDKQLFDLTLSKPWEPSFLTSAVLSWVRAPHRPVAATG